MMLQRTGMVLVALLAGWAPGQEWIGARGPRGTGVYPASSPPVSWDVAAGTRVRWVAPLNGWGQGQPVVADGRVFLMLEPDVNHLFPRLQCRDLGTGKVLWEALLDHLPVAVADATERARIYTLAERLHRSTVLGATFEREYRNAQTIDERRAVVNRWIERGYVPTDRLKAMRPGDDLRPAVPVERLRLCLPPKELKEVEAALLPYGIWEEIYQTTCNFACIGKTFGAPVWCEGAIYVATAGGFFAKYDRDGKRLWATWSFKTRNRKLTGDGHDTCVRSPLIHGAFFISAAADNLTVLDRETGHVLLAGDAVGADQRLPNLGSDSIASPVVLTANQTDVLLLAGPQAFRLPDLRPLTVEGWLISGMQALVKHDEPDVVFFCGSGEHCAWPGKGKCETPPPAAVRYTVRGDTLTGKVIWSGVQTVEDPVDRPGGGYTAGMGGTAPWLLYDAGRIYHRAGAILDAATGRITTGKLLLGKAGVAARAVPTTYHLLQLAGGHVYGWDQNQMQVFTADGKSIAANVFPPPQLTEEQLTIWQGVDSTDQYPEKNLAYSHQFTFGPDCVVVRAFMHLYCFGEPR